MLQQRAIQPEWLDALPAAHPAGLRSRRDLRMINRLMGHVTILESAIRPILESSPSPCRIIEIGAGDGKLMLQLAKRMASRISKTHLILLDQVRVIEPETLQQFAEMGWTVQVLEANLWDWIASEPQPEATVVMGNLIFHHFPEQELRRLFAMIAKSALSVVACEPRRSWRAWMGAHSLGFLGCNRITRHDAVISVAAGFQRNELSQCWPNESSWALQEDPAGLFSHLFVARRHQKQS